MRVVSYRKDGSVDFERTPFWRQDNVIYAKIGNEDKVFGNYESEERAAEVFRDIHNAYAPVGMVTSNLDEGQIKAFVKSANVEMPVVQMNEPNKGITIFENVVYYMPEE